MTQEIRSRQVVRRLKERYGERSTLDYAAQRIVRSFVEWGGSGKQMLPLSSITGGPAAVPFSIEAQISDVEANPRLSVYRQNVDKDMVIFKNYVGLPGRPVRRW